MSFFRVNNYNLTWQDETHLGIQVGTGRPETLEHGSVTDSARNPQIIRIGTGKTVLVLYSEEMDCLKFDVKKN
jgi:hypothetical protein